MQREVIIMDSLGNIVVPLTITKPDSKPEAKKSKIKSNANSIKNIPIPSGFMTDETALVLLDLLKKFTKLQGSKK